MVPHKGSIYFDTLMEGVSKKNMMWGHPAHLQPYLSTFLSIFHLSIYLYIYIYIILYIYVTFLCEFIHMYITQKEIII